MQKRITLVCLKLLNLYLTDRKYLMRLIASGLLILAYLVSLWTWWVWMGYEAPLDELRTYTGVLVLSWPWWLGRIEDIVRYFGFTRDVRKVWSFSFWNAYYAVVALYAIKMLVTNYPDLFKGFAYPVCFALVAIYFERGINVSEYFGFDETRKSLVKTNTAGRHIAAHSPWFRIPQLGYWAGCIKVKDKLIPVAFPVTVLLPAIWWGILFFTIWFQGDLVSLLLRPFPLLEPIPYVLEMVLHVPFAFAFRWLAYFVPGGLLVSHIYWLYFLTFNYSRTGIALTTDHRVIACWTTPNPFDLGVRHSVIYDLQKITGKTGRQTPWGDRNVFDLIEPAKGEEFNVKNFFIPGWAAEEVDAEIKAVKQAAAKK